MIPTSKREDEKSSIPESNVFFSEKIKETENISGKEAENI